MEKKDLSPYKAKIMELSYEEKMEMSEWLHTQIETERSSIIKEKAKKVEGQMDNFLTKATTTLKGAGNNLLKSFRGMDKTEDTTSKK